MCTGRVDIAFVLRAFQKGHIDHVPVTCLDAYPEVTAWIARMMALPAVAAWYAPK